MASSGNFTTTNQYIVFWIEVIQNSQNISNNTSNVTVKVWIKRTNTGYTTYGSGTVYTNIDGVQRNVSITPSQKITSTPSAIFHQDITVNHNSDGTKILNVQVGISHDQFSSSQSSVAFNTSLTTIPRSSSISLSASTIEAGKELTVNITRASGSFTHNVYLLFGSATFPIQNGVATSAKGVISLDTLRQIPNAASGWGTVRCETYNGGTKIGTTEKNITITAPATIVPSYSSLKVTRVDNVVPSTWGIYVKGKSKVTLEIVGAAGTYGSTISKYSITGDDQSSTSSKYTTGVLNNSGTVTFTGVVTDSRGRTATKTANISVVDYSSPKITDFIVQRCNSGGTLTDEGTYVKVTPKWSYSSVSSKNTFSAKVDYKTKAATTWSTATTVTTSGSSYIIGGGGISANTSYDIRLTIQDAFETVTKTITIPTAKTTLDFRNGGNGIAIGKVCERDGLEVDWETAFNRAVIFGKNVGSNPSNSGKEAKVVRGYNDQVGSLKVQLGGDNASTFEVVDPAWTRAFLKAGQNGIESVGGLVFDPSTVTLKTSSNQKSYRFPNGLQLNIIRYQTPQLSFDGSWGSLRVTGVKMDLPNYLESFMEVPTVTKTVEEGGGNNAFINSGNKATTTHPGGYELLRGGAGSNYFIIQVISIGRWK